MTKKIVISALLMIWASGAVLAQDPEKKVKAPRVAIHVAVLQGNIKAVEQHIAAGTDLNQKDPYGGSTPLITAATFGRTEVAKALIEAGADLNATNNEGSTALLNAAFFCRTEILRALLAAGADKTITNKYGSTPLASVSTPFENVKPIYEQVEKSLKDLGLRLDYKQLEETRPVIAELLKAE